MPDPLAYIPGTSPARIDPLGRYLPPIPQGVASAWLSETIPTTDKSGLLVLDPFCAAPRLVVEAAAAGYRVLVAANNPIARFLLEMAANPPSEADMRSALSELASTRRGDERLEPYIQALYTTSCVRCEREVSAAAFLWDRDTNAPFARIYQCPYCHDEGEYPTTPADVARAAQFSGSGLHRARALERVAALDDPDRHNVEEALSVYLPRALVAVFNIINRLDGLTISADRRNYLLALCLTACDLANTMWPYPTERARPRQLTIPPRFRENNVWLVLEQAISQWTPPSTPIPVVHWPELPPIEGGISLFEGRLKDLAATLPGVRIGAVLAPLPRPNQAFWTLSALWAGWLWGREAVGHFKSALRRRRYDWTWHSIALHSVLESLASQLEPHTPVFGMIGENEPGFLSASLVAAEIAGFQITNVAMRSESGQAQITWECVDTDSRSPLKSEKEGAEIIRNAARNYLRLRGEPTSYLNIHAAGLTALLQTRRLAIPTPSPADLLAQVNDSLDNAFSFRGGFLRLGGSEKSLEVGQWWLRETTDLSPPLADRVELELVSFLHAQPGSTLLEIDRGICKVLPGLFTPSSELIQVCLESYAEQDPPGSGRWHLRGQEEPTRQADLEEIHLLLTRMGNQMGFSPQGEKPLVWLDKNGQIQYCFYIIATAIISDLVFGREFPAEECLLVIPGGRANLTAYKLHRDLRLRQAVEAGWRFVKYRQVRSLAESPLLIQETLDDHFSQDALNYDAPQLHLF